MPAQKKTILITGAAGRLGSFLVNSFLSSGVRVAAVVHSRESREAMQWVEDHGGAVAEADVTDEEAVQRLFPEVISMAGVPDAVIHTVGMWEARPLLATSGADWDRVMQVNLRSTFLVFREAVRAMQSKGGRLVAIASRQGVDGAPAEQAAYAASKSGVVRLVESVAAEHKEAGISAFAVAPSTILYRKEETGPGVHVESLSDRVYDLCFNPAATALSGQTVRVYGAE